MSLHGPDDDRFHHESNGSTRPHSIDLTLELERQLEIDSLPNSPVNGCFSNRPHSLDPQVLASIVTQLRLSLADVTKERDELANQLSEIEMREASLKDALHSISEKCLRVEAELSVANDKAKEDQDAIVMLRGKLEDSRRALMRLQTENRRASQIPNLTLDLSRGSSVLNGPSTSSRRTSFTPLTGSPAGRNIHRRVSSVSDSGYHLGLDQGQWSPTPNRSPQFEVLQSTNATTASTFPAPPPSSRRISGFFGRPAAIQPELSPTVDASEVEELRKELAVVREQLEETRHELSEAKEAQEASETCANALRTFIAENSIGMQPPASSTPVRISEAPGRASISGSRWGFKLWGTPAAAPSQYASPALPPAIAPASASAPPLSRKLGGFFSSRGSVSSTSSSFTRPDPQSHQQEPICNGSDVSSTDDSITEPVSPASEVPRSHILVQRTFEPNTVSSGSPEAKKSVKSLHDVALNEPVIPV